MWHIITIILISISIVGYCVYTILRGSWIKEYEQERKSIERYWNKRIQQLDKDLRDGQEK